MISVIAPTCIIAIVIIFQIIQFWKTSKSIKNLSTFFPCNMIEVEKVNCSVVPSDLEGSNTARFLSNLRLETDEEVNENGEIYETVTLLKLSHSARKEHPLFANIIDQTNLYLCKNVGTAADLDILKDICGDKVSSLENNIHNALNIPLYLGLGGTFIGIIVGLGGIDIQEILAEGGSMLSVQHMLWGIIGAMSASFIGLALTVKNTSISLISTSFKDATKVADEQKEKYYDFLRRELMPVLAHSMASSLNSLKSVLGHFVDKFGERLNDYSYTAELLNENLDKQQNVLEAINKFSLTETATKTAEIFLTLKDASSCLNIFYDYQQMLNQTISNVSKSIMDISTLLDKFDAFGQGLKLLLNNNEQMAKLQDQFKESIETHFPTGGDAKELWRKEFDNLAEDSRIATMELQEQLKASTQYIKNFVENNHEFMDTFNHLKEVITTMTTYANNQTAMYNDLKNEIFGLRSDFKSSQRDAVQVNKDILEAVKLMTTAIKNLK